MTRNSRASLRDLSADDITKACEQNYIDYWRCVGLSANAKFSDAGGITQCITGLPQDIFNVVLKCNLSEDSLERSIDLMVDRFKSLRLNLIWHVGKLTEPSDLGRYLECRGHPHDYDLAAMAADLDSVDESIDFPEGIAVRAVVNDEDSREWVECLTRSWECPAEVGPWMLDNLCFNVRMERERDLSLPRKMYLGLLNGKPVGASMLFWTGGLAGLQTVGTAHSGRGRGVGGAVVKAPLVDARTLGFRYVVVLSTVEGVGMYKKVGFKTFGKLPEYSMDFR